MGGRYISRARDTFIMSKIQSKNLHGYQYVYAASDLFREN